MRYTTSLSTKLVLGAVLILCLACGGLLGQKPADSNNKNSLICGVPSKTHTAPAGTTAENIIYDRFGNSYSMVEMEEAAFFRTPISCTDSEDFILDLDDNGGVFTEEERNVICDVFTYLSSIIEAPSGEQAIIYIEKVSLPDGIGATGSPYFPNECGLGHSLVHRQLTTGGQPRINHGIIEINPSVNFYYEGYEGTRNIAESEVDFYTLVLHEALHVLGFGSQISNTGAPTQDFYTQWDLGLRAPNGEPLILRGPTSDDECCATYSFNPATNLNLPSDVLNQNCSDPTIITTTNYAVSSPAPIYGEYTGNSNAIFLNTLSHLNNDCTPGIDTDHVMNSSILPGEAGVQRTLSAAENEIICFLGYELPDGGCVTIPPCITLAANDGVFFVGQGETINIPFADLLANDITSDITPVLVENCGIPDGLTIEQIGTDFQVDGNTIGVFSFCYIVTDCDGACDVATVKVVVTNPAIATACSDTENCQINPYSDFNLFGSGEEMRLALSNGLGDDRIDFQSNFQFTENGGNSPDLYPGGGNNFIRSLVLCGGPSQTRYQAPDGIGLVGFVANGLGTLNEGLVIPLCEPIMPNMSADITFFGVTPPVCVDKGINLRVDFTELPPVSGEVVYDNPGTAIPSLFHPITATIDNPQSDGRNTLVVHNTSDACLNYLYMSTSFIGNTTSDMSFGSLLMVGDIKVTIKNDLSEVLNLSSTPNISSPTIGEVTDIEISLENVAACAGNTTEYPASLLSLQIPSGVIHEPNDDFPGTNIFIDENELDPDGIYTLRVRVDDPALSEQELVISATMTTDDPCYDGTIISEIATIIPCLQPTPGFTAQLVDGECGIYNYTSDPSSVGTIHRWYLNEQVENAIFSMEANPTNHILPDGVHTIIHVVEGRCGTEVFEVNLAPVNCGNFLLTCPCEGDDAINIEAGSGTLLSQLIADGEMPANGITNKCLAINGHLLVDAASVGNDGFYRIFESEVRMQPGSSITVKSEGALSILGSSNGDIGIHGCESLWQGISLESATDGSNGGRLYLGGAIVEDAVHAVELGNNSTFEMILTTLNNNYRGIYMPESTSNEYQTVFQPTFPFLSSITSTGELLPHYLGDTQNFTNSRACIELNDCKGFQVGGGNLLGLIMSDANSGIISSNSNISVYRSAIFSMIDDPLDFRSNSGIRAEDNSWIELRNSRLFDLTTGISGRNSSLRAFSNTIGEVPEGGVRGDVNNGISLSTNIGNFVEIANENKFNVTHFGVRIGRAQRANSILVQDNIVELYPFSETTGLGIWLTGALMSGDNEDKRIIRNNVINLYEFGHGIALNNVNGVTIVENNINYSSFPVSSYSARGIFFALSSDNYAYGNTVSGNGVSNTQRGIEVIGGDRNALCCNFVENTKIGVSFIGYCEDAKLRHTTLNNNSVGLQCFSDTRIGQQFAAGNTWDVSSSVQAKHLSTVTDDVIQSRFFVAGSPGSTTRPNDETHFSVSADWFVNGPNATSCEVDISNCVRPELNRLAGEVEFTQKVLQAEFLYGSYPETSDWEAKRVLYRSQRATKLEDQSNWSNESKAFFAKQFQEKSALNGLTVIDQTLEEALRTDPLVAETTSVMNTLNDQLFNLDQTLEEGVEPTSEYRAERLELLKQKANAFADFSTLLQQKESDYVALVAQLKQDNNSVLTSIEAAAAMKTVNYWYFETMAGGLEDLPPSAETALREMAERCPQRFGSAVGRAQSILIHYDKLFIPSEGCKEDEKSGFKDTSGSDVERINSQNQVLTIADVHIYPNPASGVFTVQLPQNEAATSWRIEMLDLRGQLLETQISQGREVEINSAKFSAGVYLIRVQSKGSSISKRVIIQ